MANIKGITIEIGAETTGFNKGLRELNKSSKDLQNELNAVNRALKHDPKNTELLKQKQELLTKSVDETKTKLDALKQAKDKADRDMANGTEINQEEYRKLQREISFAETKLDGLKKETKDFGDVSKQQLKIVGDKFSEVGDKIQGVGKKISVGITAPIAGIAAASQAAFNEVDTALDTIVTKTGATGEAAEDLNNSFKEVYKNIPADAQEVGDAIGEVNTQFALTGETLEKATEQIIKFSQINGQDVTSSTTNSKAAMEAFGLTVDDLNSTLDAVTKTAQNTGVGTDKIFDSVTKGAPQLKELGLDFAQSAEVMGRFEQKGIDSSKALSYLSKAQVVFAKDGKTLSDGLDELVGKIENSSSETEALTLASEYFGAKGATFMLDAIQRGALNFDEFAGSAENAQGAVTSTFEGTLDPVDQLKTSMNNLKLVGTDLSSAFQEVLAPMLDGLVEKLKAFSEWFTNLSDGTKTAIVVIGGIAAAAGPLLIISGKMAGAVGSILKVFGKLSPVMAGTTTAATTATPAIAGLGTTFGTALLPILPWAGAIAGVTAAGVLLYKHFSKESIPAVKLFGEETSEGTKKAVEAYMELDENAGQSLMNLKLTAETVSIETKDTLVNNFNQMGEQIKAGMDKKFDESLSSLQTFFDNSSALTQAEEQKILEDAKVKNEAEKAEITAHTQRIQEILDYASNQGRALKAEEIEEINNLQQTMKVNAVQSLSETELESKAILERMKQQHSNLTAQQAVEVVKNSLEQKEKAVENADAQYNETIKAIIRQRDESGTISAEQASKLIAEAERQRDETIKSATEMHNSVVEQAKQQAGDHVAQVDWEKAEVKTKWTQMLDETTKKINAYTEQRKQAWKNLGVATKEFCVEIKQTIVKIFTELPKQMIDIGRNVIEGLWQGITGAKDWFMKKLGSFADSLPVAVKKILGIRSPSRVFAEIGKYIVQGLGQGIDENGNIAVDEFTKLCDNIIDTADDISTGILSINEKTGEIIANKTYKNAMDRIDLYYKDRDKRISLMREATDENIKLLEKDVVATEKATNAKIKLYQQEYMAKASLIDNETNEQVKALQAELDAMDKAEEQRRRENETQEYNDELGGLYQQLKETSGDENARILEKINSTKAKREETLRRQELSDKKDAIRAEMELAREKAAEQKKQLEEELKVKEYNLEQQRKTEIEHMTKVIELMQEQKKIKEELEKTQTDIKDKEKKLQTKKMDDETKKQTENEISELQNREKELKKSLGTNESNLRSFTPKILEISKGYGSVFLEGFKSTEGKIMSYVDDLCREIFRRIAKAQGGGDDADGSHRTGLGYVPFDGYRSILHKGEMVLTQPEADRYRSGGTGKNDTTINNNFYGVKEERTAYEVARETKKTIRKLGLA